MNPKEFRQTIYDWKLNRFHMKTDMANPMKPSEISSFVEKLKVKASKKTLEYVFEFGGAFKHPYTPVPDAIIPGSFSPSHRLGEFYMMHWREILDTHKMLTKVSEDGDFDDLTPINDPDIKPLWHCAGWLPFATNGAGDFLCIDFEPAKSGTKGQVICVPGEMPERLVLASSMNEFFERLCDSYVKNKLYINEDYELRKETQSTFPVFKRMVRVAKSKKKGPSGI